MSMNVYIYLYSMISSSLLGVAGHTHDFTHSGKVYLYADYSCLRIYQSRLTESVDTIDH